MPLFTQAAGDAQRLYNNKSGYNIYQGPTQANFSPQRLEGLNRAMTMTGSRSPAITNDSIYNTQQIQDIRGMIKAQQDARAAQAAAAAQAQAPKQQPQSRRIWVDNINGNSWGPRGGYWTDAPPDYYGGGSAGGKGR